MNSWSSHRKHVVFLVTFLAFVILAATPLYLYFHRAPTCFDTKQNGTESGVDCGGGCSVMCKAESLPILSKGDPRVIRVTASTYDVVVYAQNPNVQGTAKHAGYTVKLYNATSTEPIETLTGNTYVPKNSSFGIFLGPFSFTKGVPSRVVFLWDDNIVFEKDPIPLAAIRVADPLLVNVATKPRLTATLESDAITPVTTIEVVAFVLDENGNTIGASKTIVDSLPAGGKVPLIFTWREPFVGTTTAVEIVPRVFPDRSYLK